MLTRAQLMSDKTKLFDKVYGSISGLAIGDSFGDAARKPDQVERYGFTTDFNKGATWSTDDTEFALLTCQTILDCKGELTSQAVVDAWLKNVAIQDEFKRGGGSEIETAVNLLRGYRPPDSGRFGAYYTSDGAAMRIGPIGTYCAGDPEKAARLAEIDASVSHYRDGIWGAQAVAVAVSMAMVDADMDEILNTAMSYVPKDSWFYHNVDKAFEIIEKQNGDLYDSWMKIHDISWSTYRATVAEAVTLAFCALKLEHSTFRKGIVIAGNFGRDADTIGAVAGAVLGAKYGASAIPEGWSDRTRYPSGTCLQFTKGLDLKKLAEQMVEIM